ncbi:MAG: F0F1 ATP synthase subunit beta [Candidatus Andersenbacteria bacterium]|nr:F0F1 ATP synthase subunit beta [bacterium]MDZ4225729.1 F0F1 ATP synthase subunit beta [Candidatus Andersenbacteria bacterium]
MKPTGTITAVNGQIAKVSFSDHRPTRHDILMVAKDSSILLEVVSSISPRLFFCFILNPEHQLSRGDKVQNTGAPLMIPVGQEVLGRAFDIFGNAHDSADKIKSKNYWPLFDHQIQSLAAVENPTQVLETGIKAIDFFTPVLSGGRTAFIGGAGVGKTVILTAIINRLVVQAHKQKNKVAVYSAVGERSREAQELREELERAKALPFTSIVLGQMGENPALRFRTAYAGATIAEYFRDKMATDVLFFMDNMYRFAQAGHELATLMGEIPSEDGYQPTLASEMANLNERLISTQKASITSFLAIFVPSDDLTDHGVRSVFPFLDSMIILSREVYQAGILPAIDLLKSISSALNPLTIGDKHYQSYIQSKQILEKATDLKRIVSLVGEGELSQDNQKMYLRSRLITNFMTQDLFTGSMLSDTIGEYIPRQETIDAIYNMVNGKYDDIKPDDLLYIGSIKNLKKQARSKAAEAIIKSRKEA